MMYKKAKKTNKIYFDYVQMKEFLTKEPYGQS